MYIFLRDGSSSRSLDCWPCLCYTTGMSLPQLIPQSKIDALRIEQRSKFVATLTNEHSVKLRKEKRKLQKAWLEAYTILVSPRLVCERQGLPWSTYQEWRDDPDFCEMFNDTLRDMYLDLQGSVYARAKGWYVDDGEGGIATDPTGRPLIEGGSDTLAAKLLRLDRVPENNGVVVNIEIVPR